MTVQLWKTESPSVTSAGALLPSSGEVDVGKLVEAIFETEPFKSLKKSLLEKAEKMWNDLSTGVKVPAIVVAGGGALVGLAASYKAPGGIPPFAGGISSPAIKLYENPRGVKIELKFSGKAGGGNWEGTAILQGRFWPDNGRRPKRSRQCQSMPRVID